MATVSIFLSPTRKYQLTLDAVQKDFVLTIRAVEAALGIFPDLGATPDLSLDMQAIVNVQLGDDVISNLTYALETISSSTNLFSERSREVVLDIIPRLHEIAVDLGIESLLFPPKQQRESLTTT